MILDSGERCKTWYWQEAGWDKVLEWEVGVGGVEKGQRFWKDPSCFLKVWSMDQPIGITWEPGRMQKWNSATVSFFCTFTVSWCWDDDQDDDNDGDNSYHYYYFKTQSLNACCMLATIYIWTRMQTAESLVFTLKKKIWSWKRISSLSKSDSWLPIPSLTPSATSCYNNWDPSPSTDPLPDSLTASLPHPLLALHTGFCLSVTSARDLMQRSWLGAAIHSWGSTSVLGSAGGDHCVLRRSLPTGEFLFQRKQVFFSSVLLKHLILFFHTQ